MNDAVPSVDVSLGNECLVVDIGRFVGVFTGREVERFILQGDERLLRRAVIGKLRYSLGIHLFCDDMIAQHLREIFGAGEQAVKLPFGQHRKRLVCGREDGKRAFTRESLDQSGSLQRLGQRAEVFVFDHDVRNRRGRILSQCNDWRKDQSGGKKDFFM